MNLVEELFDKIKAKKLNVNVNLARPTYVQPEDRILFRSHRVLIILNQLNTVLGLSKNVIACIDFLFRNSRYQGEFVLQYFKEQNNVIKKFSSLETRDHIEFDYQIVRYKSVPWDLRFNDMILFLLIRDLISFQGTEQNPKVKITEKGSVYANRLNSVFSQEIRFLELFGKRVSEKKAIKIITEVIPNSYWKQNEKSFY